VCVCVGGEREREREREREVGERLAFDQKAIQSWRADGFILAGGGGGQWRGLVLSPSSYYIITFYSLHFNLIFLFCVSLFLSSSKASGSGEVARHVCGVSLVVARKVVDLFYSLFYGWEGGWPPGRPKSVTSKRERSASFSRCTLLSNFFVIGL
jgi:hypothetical protein